METAKVLPVRVAGNMSLHGAVTVCGWLYESGADILLGRL